MNRWWARFTKLRFSPVRGVISAKIRLILGLTVCLANLPPALGTTMAILELRTGRLVEGELQGRDGSLVRLLLRDSGGEVILSFRPAEIRRVRFPDPMELEQAWRDLEEDAVLARPILAEAWQRRLPYLDITGPEAWEILRAYLQATEAVGDWMDLLAHGRAFLDQFPQAEQQAHLRRAVVLGYFHLGMDEAAATAAREWIRDHEVDEGSALGWYVLATQAWQRREWEEVLWIALQPLVFSSHANIRYLAQCYTLAAASHHRLGNLAAAEALFREMKDLGLGWTTGFAPFIFSELVTLSGTERTFSPETDGWQDPLPAGYPAPDPRLLLDQVRKVLPSSQPFIRSP